MVCSTFKKHNWKYSYLWARGFKTYKSKGFANLDTFNKPVDPGLYFGSYENQLYPPYLLSPSELDIRWEKTNTWDKEFLFAPETHDEFCNTKASGKTNDHAWHIDYDVLEVETPAYTGPAIRVRFMEAWLREDWYLAEGIGVVRIEAVNINRKAWPKEGNIEWTTCDATKDKNCRSERIIEPDNVTVLKEAYLGEKLLVNTTNMVKPGEKYDITLTYKSSVTGKETPYRGFVEAKVEVLDESDGVKDTIVFFLKDQYIDNGKLNLPAGSKGKYRIAYRR
ncbi:MAG: hypothetical protein ACOCXT_00030 [Candidatus Dojkabacteria bacterium]